MNRYVDVDLYKFIYGPLAFGHRLHHGFVIKTLIDIMNIQSFYMRSIPTLYTNMCT